MTSWRPFERNEVVVFNPPIAFRLVLEGELGNPETVKKAREALIKRIVAVAVSTNCVYCTVIDTDVIPTIALYWVRDCMHML